MECPDPMYASLLRLSCLVPFALALAPIASHAAAAKPPEFFVSPSGNDAWSGKLPAPNAAATNGPFRTLDKARDAVRALRPTNGAVVTIRRGDYRLDQPFTLGPEDSGSEGHPIVYRAYPGEKPRITGARAITGFKPWKGDILQCDLRAQGFPEVRFRQLFCNGQRQVLARYPNLDRDDPHAGQWAYIEAPSKDPGFKFQPYAPDLKGWTDVSQAEVFLFHKYNWYNTILPVAGIDNATRTVALGGAPLDAIVGDGAERYYFQNVLEALDSPGEWYLDYKTEILYFWPPVPLDQAEVEAPVAEDIIKLLPGASHIILRGLTVEMGDATGLDMRDTVHCLAAGCTVRNTGVSRQIGSPGPWESRAGICIAGGHDNGAVGNDISDTGSHGIFIAGGDQKTLTPGHNYAENNVIHHTGVVWAQGCGARLEGVGNRFSRNLIYDCPRIGIIFGGNDQVVEYNHIHHTNSQTCDTGAIYTAGRTWLTPRGCIVRYNYIHDIGGYGREGKEWKYPYYSWGIYLDDLSCGVDVIGNIVVGGKRGGVHLHNSRDNLVANNIFIEGLDQQIECNGWANGGEWQPQYEKNWDEYKLLPAWAKYRYFRETDPRTATQMAHNQFLHNIFYYTGEKARLFKGSRLPLDQTVSDYNLVYHPGGPILTGVTSADPLPGTPDLAPNGDFERGNLGEMPEDWSWQVRPTDKSRALLTDETSHSGARCVRIEGSEAKDAAANAHFTMIRSRDIPIKAGHPYILTAWIKTDKPGRPADLVVEAYKANAHYWASDCPIQPTGEWKQYSNGFTIPGPKDPGYQPTLKDIYIRLDFRVPEGTLWVDEVQLHEAKPIDEWRAWQAQGLDMHSLLADPLFVDMKRGDYRLKPGSPALKLGFKPIAVDRIGPYKDEWRASWPVVELDGAWRKAGK
jgi:parallel beta-helix repeat protein